MDFEVSIYIRYTCTKTNPKHWVNTGPWLKNIWLRRQFRKNITQLRDLEVVILTLEILWRKLCISLVNRFCTCKYKISRTPYSLDDICRILVKLLSLLRINPELLTQQSSVLEIALKGGNPTKKICIFYGVMLSSARDHWDQARGVQWNKVNTYSFLCFGTRNLRYYYLTLCWSSGKTYTTMISKWLIYGSVISLETYPVSRNYKSGK
jgi:hypothetical protein